ncbi:AAA family ATPase [Bacillus salacetis]|uniref:AAA family ATPase n=1 Tax=Bacillus salacetis TaxID=2315464 RepID=UPI001443E435|nr:AAA family ATPase [Bacillus salacetis]
MSLELKNIGLINYANVKIDGLSIIAGENDTGKSTIGKTMFAIIKAFSRYEQDFNEDNKRQIYRLLHNIFMRVRRLSNIDSLEINLVREFSPPKLMKEIEFYLDMKDIESIENLLNYRIYLIEDSKLKESEKELIISKLISLIKEISYFSSGEKKEYINNALRLAFMSEFGTEISNKLSKGDSWVKFSEGLDNVLEVSIRENIIENLSYSEEELFFNDVTYIETPFILQMYDLIERSTAFLEDEEKTANKFSNIRKSIVPFHIKDIINKLANSEYFNEITNMEKYQESILNKINNIVDGEVVFNKKKRDFFYQKEYNGEKFRIKSANIASGVKAFSLIQMLVKSGILNDRSLFIVDEPEIHLHPKWQVEYCKIIVELVKNGVPVLVTTHSPYILQALKVFSDKAGIYDKTNFYFAEKVDNNLGTEVYEVNENLNKVFRKLSDPLQKLVWE